MKYIKLFENRVPDLRKLGEFVYCKKTLHDEISYEKEYDNGFQHPGITYITTLINFIEGKYYKVSTFYGDPQSSVEKLNLDYVPMEYISIVVLIDYSGIEYKLKVNNKYKHSDKKYKNGFKDFYEFFEIPIFSDSMKKYNL